MGVIKNIEKVFPQKGFPAAEVDLKDLQPVKFIDKSLAFIKIELLIQTLSDVPERRWVRRLQTGNLPCDVDRRPEILLYAIPGFNY